MQRNLTWILFGSAVVLFALIYFVERKIPGTAERLQPKRVLPVTSVDDIRTIRITLPAAGTIRAEKTNGTWVLTEPRYPANQIALDTFTTNLVELRAFDRISSHEATLQGQKQFGLEPPRASVEVQGTADSIRFEIGGISPITSNLYVRLPRTGEILLANANLLETLPRGTNDWRTATLFQLSGLDFDHIQVRAGQRSFELGRVATNNSWQISKPVPARANQERVLDLLQVLRSAEASEFITDSPGADLERFGLQSPELEVSFSTGTNRNYTIEFGNSPTNRTNEVFARLLGQSNVVLAPRPLLAYLKQPYKSFHDPRLVTMSAPALDRIVVHARESFTLQRQPQGNWIVDDKSKTPVDRDLLIKFASAISSFQIFDIVKEVPTDADLKAFGLLPPSLSYAFFQKLTNASGLTTNILFTDLNFGAAQVDKVYVRRSDENPIYLTELAGLLSLPKRAFELRDRRIWRFSTNNIAALSLTTALKTNVVTRAPGGWSPDAIANAQLEEIAYRVAQLDAQEWVEKGQARLATFGFNDKSPLLTVEVRSPSGPERYSLRFGRQTLRRDVYAAITFPGDSEPTIFEFPGDLYLLLMQAAPLVR